MAQRRGERYRWGGSYSSLADAAAARRHHAMYAVVRRHEIEEIDRREKITCSFSDSGSAKEASQTTKSSSCVWG